MPINGVEILSEKILYGPQGFGLAAAILFFIIGIFLFGCWLDRGFDNWACYIGIIIIILALIALMLTSTDTSSTFLNKPTKIQYEIEITDDNAWKKLGPNYTVKEKVYETKEIYVVEGDYIND